MYVFFFVQEEVDDVTFEETTSRPMLPPVVPEIIYSCIVCGTIFAQVSQVLEHIMKTHRGGVLCLKCKYVMPSNPELKEHEKICDSERPFFLEFVKCSVCCTHFQQTEELSSDLCKNCVSHNKQNIALAPTTPSDNFCLQDQTDSDLQPSVERLIADNTNNEYIDINTYLECKSGNVSNFESHLVANNVVVLENENMFAVNENLVEVCKTNDKLTTDKVLHCKSNDNLNVCNDEVPSKNLHDTAVSSTSTGTIVKKKCWNRDCQCLVFANEKLEMSVCKKLCNIRDTFSSLSEKNTNRNMEYCVFCLVCRRDLLLDIYFTTHLLKYHKCKCYMCPLCGHNITRRSIPSFLKHVEQHLDLAVKRKTIIDCNICKASFFSDYNLQQHSKVYHSPLPNSVTTTKPLLESDLRKIESMKKFCSKQNYHENFTFHCNSCGIDFPKNDYFDNHLLQCMKEDEYSCSLCFEHKLVDRETFLMQMWVHCLMVDNVSHVTCSVCKHTFPNFDNLLMHKANQHSGKSSNEPTTDCENQTSTSSDTVTIHSRNLDIHSQKDTLHLGFSDCNQETNTVNVNSCEKAVPNTSSNVIANLPSCGDSQKSQSLVDSKKTKRTKKKKLLMKPQKIGKDDLTEVEIPNYIKQQVKYILKWCKNKNTTYKNKECAVFCLSCKEDVLFKDYITTHFITCFETNGGTCPFCCRESEDERSNVLDHLMHVWNSHFATKWQFKEHLCMKCDIVLTNSYNIVMHNALKHTSKSSSTKSELVSAASEAVSFEFCVVKCETSDNEYNTQSTLTQQ